MVLPDGSRTLIPAAWTDWNGRQDDTGLMSSGGDADAVETLCTISDLLKARAVTDALLSRLVESAPEQEGDDANGPRSRPKDQKVPGTRSIHRLRLPPLCCFRD